MRYTRDNDQAMDVVQEGFVKVFSNLERYTGVGSFEGWIRRIMVNLSIDRFRKLKHDFLLLGENQNLEDWEEEIEQDAGENDMDAIYDIRPEQIVDAMQQLSPAYRTVFNLYVYENYTHQDIAESLGISVGTSKSNYSKARRNMKKLLLKELKKTNEQNFNTV